METNSRLSLWHSEGQTLGAAGCSAILQRIWGSVRRNPDKLLVHIAIRVTTRLVTEVRHASGYLRVRARRSMLDTIVYSAG